MEKILASILLVLLSIFALFQLMDTTTVSTEVLDEWALTQLSTTVVDVPINSTLRKEHATGVDVQNIVRYFAGSSTTVSVSGVPVVEGAGDGVFMSLPGKIYTLIPKNSSGVDVRTLSPTDDPISLRVVELDYIEVP